MINKNINVTNEITVLILDSGIIHAHVSLSLRLYIRFNSSAVSLLCFKPAASHNLCKSHSSLEFCF